MYTRNHSRHQITPSHAIIRRTLRSTAWLPALILASALAAAESPPPPEDAPAILFEEAALQSAQSATSTRGATPPSAIGGSPWVAQGPGPALNGQTENVTPNNEVSGAVHVVLPHPSTQATVYIGAANGGVWKTTDATAASPTWTPLTDFQESLSIGALEFDFSDGTHNTLVAGVGRFSSFSGAGGSRAGIYRTTNGGADWTHLTGGGTLTGKNISGVAARGSTIVLSINFADVFSCGNLGIYRSTNTGTTFTEISSSTSVNGLPRGVAFDLEGTRSATDTLYTAVNFTNACSSGGDIDGIYKSTDTGATWTRVSDATMNTLVTDNTSNIEIATFGVSDVYVAILNFGQLSNGGVFRSTDGGSNWTQLDVPETTETGGSGGTVGTNPTFKPEAGTPGSQGTIHFSIAVDDTSSNILYVGGDRQPRGFQDLGSFPNSIGANNFSGRLFRGNANATPGSQWVHLTHTQDAGGLTGGGTASNSSPHADSREMAFDAAGELLESDDGGVYRRTSPTDNTGDWESIIGNLQVTEHHDVTYDNLSNIVMGGNQDTGTTFQFSTGSQLSNSLSTADGGDVGVDNITLAGSSQSIRYSSFQNNGSFRRTIWNSSGGVLSATFPALTGFDDIGDAWQFRTPFELNRITPARIVFGATFDVWESTDSGSNVSAVPSAFAADFLVIAMDYGGVASSSNNADVLWVGGFDFTFFIDRVLVRTGGGSLVDTSYAGSVIVDLEMDPSAWTTCYVIDINGAVWRTANTGSTYSNITGNLINVGALRSITYVENTSEDWVIVGADLGVFVTPLSSLGTWNELGDNLPNAPVWDMRFDDTDDVLIAGTLGRGSWKITDVENAFSSAVAADNIWVDTAHVGAEFGTSLNPFKTITPALPFVNPGGILHVVGGTYSESPITINQDVTIIHESGANVVVD